ncbi:glycosyltransferase family 1 protein [Clostridium algidicarnis]|uniref:glycosyltransferase family 1 protein n=1 Tax=Clostridium algidicarnis TaxID=37659 RepID=UPI001629C59B|nr:glycosyltransferase family 1 protein [Clostridium algidicarnis]MBB6631974.1 glycosyltransferase family 1 protein [Clostridium algidicarnis]
MNKPIRILHVLGALNRGGAETMIMNIYRNIDRSKIQFDFMIHTNEKCDYDDEIIKLGGKIYSVPRYVGKNHFKYKHAWDTFFSSHTEHKIVHGHMRSTAAIYLEIAKKHGLVTIAHSHSTASRGNKIEQLVKSVMQFRIRYRADYLFACSNEAGKWLFGKKAISKDNYKIIKNAIDVEKYVFNEVKRSEIRTVLDIEDKFVVGHVGSFTYPKNHKFLIEVFYQIQMQNKNAVLLLVGDGELRSQIENQINKLRIKDKVILTGVVPNVNDYMQAMDVFVFPSLWEGLPVTVIEAQATGLHCVISDTITDEVKITQLVKALLIDATPDSWANQILTYTKPVRENTKEYICNAGYDIKTTTKWLEDFYISEL